MHNIRIHYVDLNKEKNNTYGYQTETSDDSSRQIMIA